MATMQERAELHKTIWKIANDLRGSVDGWEFKAYVLGSIFYRFISENICDYIHQLMTEAGQPDFDYAAFVQRAFQDGYVTETGTGIAKILPPSNPFLPESGEKKQTVINKLKDYLNKFMGTVTPVNINLTVHNHYHGTVETVVNIGETEE